MSVVVFGWVTVVACWLFVMMGGYGVASLFLFSTGYTHEPLIWFDLALFVWPALSLALALLMCRDLIER